MDGSSVFVYRQGRRYLRDAPEYPLPIDLAELNRQTLRTTLLIEVFGTPFSAKLARPPEKILEVICGPAVWSLKCHQYLRRQGQYNAAFTGLDLAPVAPDLTKHGVNWRFVQHDVRKPPMPFNEEEFDLIMVNDGAAVIPSARDIKLNPITALKRYLKPGGCIEVIESDYVFRCLQPEPATAPGTASRDATQARRTATYTVGPATPFSKAQNRFLADYNRWAERALGDGGISATPCAVMSFALATESTSFAGTGSRRVAIPFSDIRWENDVEAGVEASDIKIPTNCRKIGKRKGLTKSSAPIQDFKPLTPNQAALRRTALTVAVGLIESLEPLLMKESGKKRDEWDRWWGSMMTDLFEHGGTVNGECLEVGNWWARKEVAQEDE